MSSSSKQTKKIFVEHCYLGNLTHMDTLKILKNSKQWELNMTFADLPSIISTFFKRTFLGENVQHIILEAVFLVSWPRNYIKASNIS